MRDRGRQHIATKLAEHLGDEAKDYGYNSVPQGWGWYHLPSNTYVGESYYEIQCSPVWVKGLEWLGVKPTKPAAHPDVMIFTDFKEGNQTFTLNIVPFTNQDFQWGLPLAYSFANRDDAKRMAIKVQEYLWKMREN